MIRSQYFASSTNSHWTDGISRFRSNFKSSRFEGTHPCGIAKSSFWKNNQRTTLCQYVVHALNFRFAFRKIHAINSQITQTLHKTAKQEYREQLFFANKTSI